VPSEKKCAKCGLVRALSDFYLDSKRQKFDGLRVYCKECCSSSNKASHGKHKEKRKAVREFTKGGGILSGTAIVKNVKAGRITITPFREEYVNPSSLDLTLGGPLLSTSFPIRAFWTQRTRLGQLHTRFLVRGWSYTLVEPTSCIHMSQCIQKTSYQYWTGSHH